MMKVNLFKTALLLLGTIPALSAAAYDVQVGDGYYNINAATQKASVTYLVRYNPSNAAAYVGDVVIPETFEHNGITYTVTSVDQRAFYSCTDLTSIVLPATITNIEDNAFYGCTALKKVVLPSRLTMLKDATFQNCSALEDITLPSTLGSIGKDVFSYCTSLKKIVFPTNCTSIGSQTFYNCTSLVELQLPEKATDIGFRAFWNCQKLTSVVLPDMLGTVGVSVFEKCSNLQTVRFGKGLVTIDHFAFNECKSLRDLYFTSTTLPHSAQETAFYETPTYKRIHVPSSLIEAYHSKPLWREFSSILPIQSATPSVDLKDGNLLIISETNLNYTDEKEVITYDVKVSDISAGKVNADAMETFGNLSLTYDVTATASVFGCEKSEPMIATICWLNHDLEIGEGGEEEGGTTQIETAPTQRAVIVQSNGGEIAVSGLDEDESIAFYDLSGRLLGRAMSSAGSANFTATAGQIIVVRVADSSFKLRVR